VIASRAQIMPVGVLAPSHFSDSPIAGESTEAHRRLAGQSTDTRITGLYIQVAKAEKALEEAIHHSRGPQDQESREQPCVPLPEPVSVTIPVGFKYSRRPFQHSHRPGCRVMRQPRT